MGPPQPGHVLLAPDWRESHCKAPRHKSAHGQRPRNTSLSYIQAKSGGAPPCPNPCIGVGLNAPGPFATQMQASNYDRFGKCCASLSRHAHQHPRAPDHCFQSGLSTFTWAEFAATHVPSSTESFKRPADHPLLQQMSLLRCTNTAVRN